MSKKKKEIEPVALDLRVTKTTNPHTKIVEDIPELDPVWVEDVQFVSYTPPPVQHSSASDLDHSGLEEWTERTALISEDLKWLLRLPHNKFWCQVIFDETLQQCLDSYLRFSPRNFDALSVLPSESLELQENIHKRVFMTYLRMSTHKESKTDYITPSTFGEILYENFLFDIPKLMDICALYGGEESGNRPLLRKMMDNIFSKQPKYHDDLAATIPTVYETLDSILQRCGLKIDTDDPSHLPQKLSDVKNGPTLVPLSVTQLEDIVLYLLDTMKTLSAFGCTYSPICLSFHKQGFVQRIAGFYEAIVPYFQERLRSEEARCLRERWRHVKMMLVNLCHMFLYTCCVDPIADRNINDEQIQALHVEDYLQVLTSVLSEKRFLSSYDARFSIQTQLEILQTAAASMDETRVEYILAAVDSARRVFPSQLNKKKNRMKLKEDVSSGSVPENSTTTVAKDHEKERTEESSVNGLMVEDKNKGATSKTVDDVELLSMVSHVQDLLPGLGDGFVMCCLEELDYDIEQVIGLLLEDNLPQSLQELDRSMSREEAMKNRKQAPEKLVEQRHSVYDKDEFDVFSGNRIDVSKVHKGKRRDRRNLKTMLADKSDITESVKERYSAYDVFDKLKFTATLYDDEYDDTYDSQNVGAQDADSADERLDQLTIRRPFTIPRVLGGSPVESEESEEESDEENATEEGSKQTTENNSGQANRAGTNKAPDKDQNPDNRKPHGRGGKDRDAKKDEGKGKNEKGGPKGGPKGRGRGVTASESRNRANNEKHKGSRANHNRKAGADRKRNKGMGLLPSN